MSDLVGLELPAELRDVAARAGARWPAADEDRMREAAAAWREAAQGLDSLTRSADATAQGALTSFDGEAAQAASSRWDDLAADGGLLPTAARQCRDAADRLDHAAEQIGAAKVELVRELVSLAQQTDAAEQAAAAGHPQALAILEPVLSGAAAAVARVHETLSTALDGGAREVAQATSGALPDVGATAGHTLGTGTGTVESSVDAAGAGDVSVVDDAERAVGAVGGAEGAQDTLREAVPEGGFGASAEQASPGWVADPGDAGTGPIPVIGPGGRPDDAPSTAPHAAHTAWAGHQPGAPPPPPAAGFAAAPPPPPQPGGYAVGGPAAPPPQQPGAPARPAAPGRGPVVPGPPPQQGQAQQGQPTQNRPPNPPPAGNVQRGALRPLPPQAQPNPAAPEPQQRPLRHGPRNADVVAFVLHQFPIGYIPVAADQASRQLPQQEPAETREGLNFPPQDHPRSDLVDDTDAVRRARSAAVYEDALRSRDERAERERIPDDLIARYDPLGELSEHEWERRYENRDAGPDHRWPQECPEGGFEPGEPVVLEPDTVVDHLGTGHGRWFCAAATPFAHRSLPPDHAERDYRRYRLLRPLPVWRSVAAPWFEQPGGGTRYRATCSAHDLVGLGYLVELTRTRRQSEASTVRLVLTGTTDGERPPDEREERQGSTG
ncbi:DUF4237 domain-containing protein [Saccharopolyspora rhizosphaerae]|uniref:DUF4237 domain-containing protein n=1 Tax=Saccharopolyspora rhizosphaerae TaxID=2492662 RepID=A0A426JHX5_9PSEU|nr:TNT domain-containing protein [Saccharopolyspora rhizosphaerae]RRO12765.1 DUF4237 domain-containing protein [Saccharopolyspora rhizosphaerae]